MLIQSSICVNSTLLNGFCGNRDGGGGGGIDTLPIAK
jgi:hypothetical protein